MKCLLEGLGVPVSYGRLREACQTDVDGTSIDTIETVANQLGVDAEQMMLPVEHLFQPDATALPALIVVRHPSGGTHFVVIWGELGGWLQLMDPAIGRRWVLPLQQGPLQPRDERAGRGVAKLGRSDVFLQPLRQRLAQVGAVGSVAAELADKALADPGWLSLGTLDASVRLVQSVIDAEGLSAGPSAVRLLNALFNATRSNTFDIFDVIPPSYWAVRPDLNSADPVELRLTLRGAVLIRMAARRRRSVAQPVEPTAPLSKELEAALREPPTRPLRDLCKLMRDEGAVRPLVLIAALVVAVATLLVETCCSVRCWMSQACFTSAASGWRQPQHF